MNVLRNLVRAVGLLLGFFIMVGGGACVAANVGFMTEARANDWWLYVLLLLVSLAVAMGGVRLMMEMIRQMSARAKGEEQD